VVKKERKGKGGYFCSSEADEKPRGGESRRSYSLPGEEKGPVRKETSAWEEKRSSSQSVPLKTMQGKKENLS